MNEFLDKMSSVLETSVFPDTRFRELEDWSSLKAFGILVTLENDYGVRMMIDEFMSKNTIGELASVCGIAE